VRRPKLEIVSFDKSSTPIIQFDCIVDTSYDKIVQLFPEGIAENDLRNVWVYLSNPYHLDICFVVNENRGGDWSEFFSGHRLMPES